MISFMGFILLVIGEIKMFSVLFWKIKFNVGYIGIKIKMFVWSYYLRKNKIIEDLRKKYGYFVIIS